MYKRAIGYSITSASNTFAGLLRSAVEANELPSYTGNHSGICSISTNTDNEYLLFYWIFSYNAFCRCISITNNAIAINNMNDQGTVVVSGGTAPYTVTVTVFN